MGQLDILERCRLTTHCPTIQGHSFNILYIYPQFEIMLMQEMYPIGISIQLHRWCTTHPDLVSNIPIIWFDDFLTLIARQNQIKVTQSGIKHKSTTCLSILNHARCYAWT